ncbi:MAG: hypothetical protein RLZZ630_46 [Bacteroidota bacterium]
MIKTKPLFGTVASAAVLRYGRHKNLFRSNEEIATVHS